VHAEQVLDDLFGGPDRYREVAELRDALATVRELPTEITRLRRATHLTLLFLLLNLPLGGLLCVLILTSVQVFFAYWEPRQRPLTEMYIGNAVLVAAYCAIWIVWAFAFRGGYTYWRGGIRLRRGDGSRGSRLQCGRRALLVWAPVGTLLCLSLAISYLYPALPWLSLGLCAAGVLLVPMYAVLALIWPARLVHDRIAGTYPVPD